MAPWAVSRRALTFTTAFSPAPLLPGLQIVQAVWVSNHPALPGFNASVTLVQGPGVVMGNPLKVPLLCPLEKVLNVIVQLTLVSFTAST